VLVHRLYLSLDPAMRGWMSSAKSYLPPVPIGEVMRGATLSEVVEVQQNDGGTLKVGDVVSEFGNDGGWQEYAIVAERSVRKVESLELPLTVHLSILGTTGLTAYFGFIDICNPLPPSNKSSSTPETVLVTAAAGAVGSIVCQIAKFVYGAKVIGVAGATSKASWLKDELQCCDEVIDYRAMEKEVEVALNRVGSKGFDMVFDNVGGYQLNEALCRLNPHARVALCGAISGYNLDMTQQSTSAQSSMTISPAKIQGFIVLDYVRQWGKAKQQLTRWIVEGKIRYQKEDIREGLENAPSALLDLFNGRNKGKLIVKVGD
ncbi:zinc-dependent alcohol dehydrogenase, partial [Thalassiosira pseudonana CCMP1335]